MHPSPITARFANFQLRILSIRTAATIRTAARIETLYRSDQCSATLKEVVANYGNLLPHFQNANGLRAGAPVRLAGVEIGTVKSVRARPEIQAAPAEVTLGLRTPYELQIPGDSTVSLSTAGVFGETFAEINLVGASDAPVKNGGVLKEKLTKVISTDELIEKLGEILQRKPCAPQGKDVATR